MQYRHEIDGLRAIAVVPVILYHAGFETFGGGYVGVDVFFVISGYLITSIIHADLAASRFRLAEFYERRARRILPALFVVMACSIPFAWQWMLPNAFRNFLESLVATATFSSNFLFWSETGYFAAPSETKPLLHTWSLAIEEQFYILFPLVLMLIWRFWRNAIFPALILIAILSFGLSVWMTQAFPSAAFYLLPTRAWELLAGSLCAVILARQPGLLPEIWQNGLAVGGVALIAIAVFAFGPDTAFPGHNALVPVLGTVLLILFGTSKTHVGKCLSRGLLPGIGLISYSAYLWHHPIFAFLRLRTLTEPGAVQFILAIVVSFGLAYLTWRFVERPLRNRRRPLGIVNSRRKVFLLAGAVSLAFVCFGAIAITSDARSSKVLASDMGPLTLSELEAQLAPNRGLSDVCNGGASLMSPECRTSADPSIIVWGDSFAMHIVDAVVAANPGVGVGQATQSNCVPVSGMSGFSAASNHNARWARGCIAFNDAVLEFIRSTSVSTVVVSSPFDILLGDADLLFRDGTVTDNADRKMKRAFLETLNTISNLGKQVVVVGPPPANGTNLGDCVAKRALLGQPLDPCRFRASDVTSQHVDVSRFLASIGPPATVIALDDIICPNAACSPYRTGGMIYRDGRHLSHWGSRHLGETHPDIFQFPQKD